MIKRVLFTWSIEMFWIEDENGNKECLTSAQLFERVGSVEYKRLNSKAHSLAGHWHTV